jgi:hypothetical protein
MKKIRFFSLVALLAIFLLTIPLTSLFALEETGGIRGDCGPIIR